MKKLLLILAFVISINCFAQDNPIGNFLNKWLNAPYKFGGNSEKGIDCSKLVQRFYKDVYNADIPGVCRKIWDFTTRVEKDSLKEGDVVFFNSRLSPSGWHAGVYLTDGYFLHAANRKERVKISSLNEEYYIKTYKGAGRLLNQFYETKQVF